MQDTVVEKEKDKHTCIQHHIFSLKGKGKKISRTNSNASRCITPGCTQKGKL